MIHGCNLRIGIALVVVVEGEAIQDDSSSLGEIHAIVHEILRRTVGRGVPERRMYTKDLLNNRADVGQILLILGNRPAVPADNKI